MAPLVSSKNWMFAYVENLAVLSLRGGLYDANVTGDTQRRRPAKARRSTRSLAGQPIEDAR